MFFMSIYTRIRRLSGGSSRLASMALSKRLPMMAHRSSSGISRVKGIWASARTGMSLDLAREILLFKMASVMGFPVLTTVSTVDRSASRASR